MTSVRYSKQNMAPTYEILAKTSSMLQEFL